MVKNESNNLEQPEMIFSVGEYIEAVNLFLKKFKAKITGEITEVKTYPSGHCYFSIKDKGDNSVLNCIMWKYDYRICGVELVEGLEVILNGEGQVYTATGKFSFVAKTVELKGEGALQKAYEQLKKKLDDEGLFAPERKRLLPEYPQNIGVITSKQGAVIHDLLTNLGKFGFKIKMVDSRVEGQEAVADLLAGVKTFRHKDIDVLVIMRGGGSLESLQAFNNEALVRSISDFPCPVMAAIGHDKDVPLLAMAADYMCSTPTAAANTINKSWEMAPLKISQCQRIIVDWFNDFFNQYKKYESQLNNYFLRIEQVIASQKKFLDATWQKIASAFVFNLKELTQKLYFIAQNVKAQDPRNNLALGYCLARKNGQLVKTVDALRSGDDFSLQMADGIVKATTRADL
ncbi:exodeoxyribonuclease VII large subunit [bacterium (Candidatus Gribaldobacteria) CG02_land_8_20_14_3_00_41_15]|uniref:Exodeoxyribonuclease 7 large subunit n=2 Tax=Candidatus Gribaldobacteria TaxID=2798536 RepID=A0A2H0UZ35_9BACT|nr:MAG: exodeoxyribonuclease VII large subunit [Parcubacteria group bacterium CG1_02_41_26]PIR91370.1 MAG: exodeoxyribonuclease VII large subunit [bacterium (Candidatus Gribaldobacteria) CG10_big_fil_rev_8_21_14_0_10_41_12]PIV46918.1 MAG: exodeoxyribonuclease VII large subunit [bacterium (Candidatus Gribaldobacteria) CG02_land_8_20_14_3_00_41_15]